MLNAAFCRDATPPAARSTMETSPLSPNSPESQTSVVLRVAPGLAQRSKDDVTLRRSDTSARNSRCSACDPDNSEVTCTCSSRDRSSRADADVESCATSADLMRSSMQSEVASRMTSSLMTSSLQSELDPRYLEALEGSVNFGDWVKEDTEDVVNGNSASLPGPQLDVHVAVETVREADRQVGARPVFGAFYEPF